MIRFAVRKLLCCCLVSSLVLLAGTTYAATRAFDMGTDASPVEKAFVRVTADQLYSEQRGFGWLGGPYQSFDTSLPTTDVPFAGTRGADIYRDAATDLRRDGVWSDGDMTFRVDLPNGRYRVWLTIGHLSKILGSIDVSANGELLAKGLSIRHFYWRSQQRHGYGWYKPIRFTADVTDGRLEIQLRGDESEYQRLLAIEEAKPRPASYGTYPEHPEKKPRDYVLLTDIGQPFVGTSILAIEVHPYEAAPLQFHQDKLVWDWGGDPVPAVKKAMDLFNESRFAQAVTAAEGIPDAHRLERGIIFLSLAGRPELYRERELAQKAVSDLDAFVAQNPDDRAARELLWIARRFRSGIERFHHRADPGKSGYTEVARGSMSLDALQPEDPVYWMGQIYRARVFYMVQPHRWSWVSGAGADILLEVEKKFPNDRFVKLYLDGQWEPNEVWHMNDYITGTEGAPEWAVACRDAWKSVLDMARWWIKNKQRPNGAIGGGWGDDVELIVDFANYVFVSEGVYPDVRQGVRNLVEGSWQDSGLEHDPGFYWGVADAREPAFKGDSIPSGIDHEAGFYWGVADVGHSAEPTTNTIPMMVLLDYGNPRWVERSMKSGKLMRDLWTAVNPKGHRHFRSDYLGGMGIRGGTVANDGWLNYRAVVPAERVIWYNNNPTLVKLFDEWALAMLEDTMKSERGKPAGVMPSLVAFADCTLGGVDSPSWHQPNKSGGFNPDWRHGYSRPEGYPKTLLGGAYERSGDERFLEPFRIQAELAMQHRANPVENPQEGSIEWVRKSLSDSDAPKLWDFVSRTLLGTEPGGARYMTHEEAKERADFVRTRVKMRWPIDTTEGLVTDRIGFGGITDIVKVYTGGGIFVRSPIVSYVNLGTEFAAFVLRSDRTHLHVALYSFYDQEKEGGLRSWNLAAGGQYRLSIGPDADGDGNLDSVEHASTVELRQRGQVIPFRLPPKQETIVALESVGKPGFGAAELLPDAAFGLDDVQYWTDKNNLAVRVHNIGSAPLHSLVVQAWEGAPSTGKLIGTSLIPYIEAPNDLVPQTVRVGFGWDPKDPTADVSIVLDPNNEITEITEVNNQLHVRPPAAAR